MPRARLVLHRPVVHQRGLLGERGLRLVARIEADEDDVEILPRAEWEHLRRARHAVHHLGAEHRAVVIDERENHGTLAVEVAAERHIAAVLVLERRVERQLRVEALPERDVLELRQARGRHGAGLHHVDARLREARLRLGVRRTAPYPERDASVEPWACRSYCLRFSRTRPELESDGNMSSGSGGVDASTGRVVRAPRSSISRMASWMGMCTVPEFLSTHP